MKTLPALTLVAAMLVCTLPARAGEGTIRRFALVAGTNSGGNGRVGLRYAANDAQTFARVMEELGGVSAQDRILLLDPDARAFTAAMDRMQAMLDAAKAPERRLEVFLYYSGHSDEDGLLLGNERIPYQQLRRALEALPADVRIAILDSCSSGALTRRKGGKHLAPFLIDTSGSVRGHAFLTSSSENEAAQESDRVGGSFFTHYLVSGLRGAADASGDGRVTLTEAYQFAFDETLARTEKTQSGPQHPAYDISLAGSGDLVMTDLRGTSSGMALDSSVEGRLFVRDGNGRLVAELRKTAGRTVELGLEPGSYDVTLDRDAKVYHAALTVAAGQPTLLSDFEFVSEQRELTAARGPLEGPSFPTLGEANLGGSGALDGYEVQEFSFSVVPSLSFPAPSADKVVKRFAFNFIAGSSDRIAGFEVGLLANVVHEEVQGAQLSSVLNLNFGTLNGLQAAGTLNLTAKGGVGTALSGGANLIGGDFKGVELAPLLNTTGGLFYGVQGAGGANIVLGELRGLQLAGGLNYLGGNVTSGGQFAGGANITGGLVNGYQAAGGMNLAWGVSGLQVAPFNLTLGDLDGTQVGVFNLATGDIRGSQIGVLNVGGEYKTGAPIGLFSIVRNGQLHLDLWSSDVAQANFGIKLGTRRFYTLIAGGMSKTEDPDIYRTLSGLGLGTTIELNRYIFLASDLSAYSVRFVDMSNQEQPRALYDHAFNLLTELRVMVGAKAFEHLGVFAGASVHGFITNADEYQTTFAGPRQTKISGGNDKSFVRLWPGFFAGVQI